ncbi:MAG: glycosyltransferase family 2 protein [Candidatus Kerfeldbacteria bacterium]|nr:glycosyltransferase family 2 protein [Candidatus Kerfeldbacteria bacterium]
MTDLSVIILNYKTRALLEQCLEALARSKTSASYEVIVVDNASDDGSADLVETSYPQWTFLASQRNLGFAGGMNIGIEHAHGRYLLCMNPDVRVEPDTLEKLTQFMDHEPRVALVGPRLVNRDGTTQFSCFRFPQLLTPIYRRSPLGRLWMARNHLKRYLMAEWDHEENRPVDWVLGACMMVRRSAMEHVGMLDDRFFLYFEDTDWCRRFWRAGFRVYYLADTHVFHLHRRQSAESPGVAGILSYPTRMHIASWMKYLLKYRFRYDEPIP